MTNKQVAVTMTQLTKDIKDCLIELNYKNYYVREIKSVPVVSKPNNNIILCLPELLFEVDNLLNGAVSDPSIISQAYTKYLNYAIHTITKTFKRNSQ